MAGRGFAPKDPGLRKGHGSKSDASSWKVVQSDPSEQPKLPDLMPGGIPWPDETLAWWEMWRVDPLSSDFRPTDWSDLLDTAVIHGAFWAGDVKMAGELRLRVAKHGATREDRARLRIQFANADEAEGRAEVQQQKRRGTPQPKPAADPRSVLRAVN